MSVVVTYRMPSQGLGTDFSEFDRPINFAATYTNRFRNITGGAERRPGMLTYASASVPTRPNLTRMHEFVNNQGVETLFTSDDFGNLYKFGTSAWSTILTGKSNVRMISAEADNKLIFVNGTDRNFYTDDAGVTFRELKALITEGTLAAGSSAAGVVDGDISNWIGATLVANNDIVFNATLSAYGIVSTVASASLTITSIGSAATGSGRATRNQAAGDVYQLIDYVDLNVIPDGIGGYDNVGTMSVGTTTSAVVVSGVNFTGSEARIGDFVYNTTRGAIAQITAVSAALNIGQSITSQAAGDALALFKSAMPIASWIHVHYGRTYFLDSRNNTNIVISAPDDPQDVTTYQKTLDSSTFSFGSQQPTGDVILSMATFLSYFVACGKKNLYIYQGNVPIQDTSSTTISFTPVAFYPNGEAGRFGLASNGGDFLHITVDGLQAISIGNTQFALSQNNVSVPIINTLRQAISNITNTDNVQLSYYPRRRWLLCKVGDQIYMLNTQASYDQTGTQQNLASWHLYTGKWAQQNHYFVRRNGDLLSCGANGGVYLMDASAATDAGDPVATDLTIAWPRLEEPEITPRIKEFHYIGPVFESNAAVEYTINLRAGLDNLSSDSIIASAGGTGAIGTGIIGITAIGGGSFAQANKYSLRGRGEEFSVQFTTQSSAAPDVITAFRIYGAIGGRR